MEVNFENTQFLEGRVATRQSRTAFVVQVGGGVVFGLRGHRRAALCGRRSRGSHRGRNYDVVDQTQCMGRGHDG